MKEINGKRLGFQVIVCIEVGKCQFVSRRDMGRKSTRTNQVIV